MGIAVFASLTFFSWSVHAMEVVDCFDAAVTPCLAVIEGNDYAGTITINSDLQSLVAPVTMTISKSSSIVACVFSSRSSDPSYHIYEFSWGVNDFIGELMYGLTDEYQARYICSDGITTNYDGLYIVAGIWTFLGCFFAWLFYYRPKIKPL